MDSKLYQKRLMPFVAKSLFLLVALFSQQTGRAQQTQVWRDSLTALNKAIAAQPWSTDLHLRKAAVNIELQQWQYAVDEYGLILRREPHNPAALFYRAYANSHLRRYDLARYDYEEMLKFFPRHMQARLSLAYVLEQIGRKQEALDQLNQTVELNPDSAVAYATRAAFERDMLQTEAALYDWQQAERLAPQNADYVASHADLLIRQGRLAETRRILDAAVARGIPRGWLQGWYQKCRKKQK